MIKPRLHSADELQRRRKKGIAGRAMSARSFSRSELAAAFGKFEQTVAQAAETRDWDAWVEHYTPDVLYIEHAAGTMRGRDEVREWIKRTMSTYPGSHMVAFPSLWSVIDEPTGRIIMELDNPMKDPGDGSVITATNISIITYAGDGLWRQQEDIYNPLRFVQAALKWCRKAQELGTLDEDAARFMEQYGGAQ
jgi:lambda repressor-like predicted transcriptional regulator